MYYVYQAVSRSGEVIEDTLDVGSIQALNEQLGQEGLELVEARIDWRRTVIAMFERKQLRRKTLIEFFSHLKGLLELGLSVTNALNTVQESLDDPALSRALGQVEDLVQKGYSLSQAFRATEAFPPLALASISAAERTNRLEQVFTELAEHYENVDALVGDAKKAATYPIIAIFVLLGVLALMLFFVVPQLRDILPANPPLPTMMLLYLADTAAWVWWAPPFLVIGGIVVYKRLTHEQRARLAERVYRVPVVGRIALNLELSTVFMNLAMLNGGGIPLLEALLIASEGTSSPFISEKLRKCHDTARQGGALSEGFQDRLFPPVVSRAIVHGEATGRFDKQFAGLAKFLRDRTARQIQFMSSFIEPALILVGGGIMLMMATAIFMPIYGQIQSMK